MESIFESKEQYLEFIKNWKKACNDKEGPKLTFEHFILYAMLRGRDYKKCISPSSSDSTIDLAEYIAKGKDFKYLSLWPFGDISSQLIFEARQRLENN